MVWIPEGRIELGPPAGARADQHRSLGLAAPLLMASTPITVAHYRATVGASPIDAASDEPVVSVGLDSARRYCDVLSIAEGFRPAYGRGLAHPADAQADGYRLPTSAHWEFACRGGTTTAWWFGDAADRLGDAAWFVANSELRPQPVGRKAPNPWGLYDVHGNVWEWTARVVGGRAEIRGGSCRERPCALRSDARALRPLRERRRTIGFRVVRPA